MPFHFIQLARQIRAASALALFITMFTGVGARAADDSAAFLEALRQRQMHDLALDYLKSAAKDRLVSAEFKQRIPYERGVTLMAKWRMTSSTSERKRLASEVRNELEQFADAAGGSAIAAEAQSQLATLLIETASRDLISLKKSTSASKADATRKRAGGHFKDARDLLTEVEKTLVEELGKFPKALDPKTQSKEIGQRLHIRGRLAQVRVVRARLLHQQAELLDDDDKEAVELNEQAAEELQALYDKYSGYPIAFVARIGQGECYLDLKKYKEATSCFESVIVQGGDNPTIRGLVTKSLRLLAKCYIEEKKYDAVLAKHGVWLAKQRDKTSTDLGTLGVKFLVAEASRLLAELPETEKDDKRDLLASAKELYQQVALIRNEYQDEARSILSEQFDGMDTEEVKRQEPETFSDTLQAAKDAINSMNAAKQAQDAAEANNPDAVAALKEQAETGFNDAMHYLE
ncbi:MAG: tetratricopeptide repeat protein, partial [Aeoliella sp.]